MWVQDYEEKNLKEGREMIMHGQAALTVGDVAKMTKFGAVQPQSHLGAVCMPLLTLRALWGVFGPN